jgi:acetylornithine deacetylase/succinyl-diaminopimelate desuccinylase-like protein
MTTMRLLAVMFLCALGAGTQASVETTVGRVFAHAAYRDAVAALDRGFPQFVSDVITITEIPAPPFQESARAAATLKLFRDAGLADASIDAAGNVVALRKGAGGPLLVIAAHLDTVFPEGTNVEVQREGSRLSAPGIGDNAQGIATLVAITRALEAAHARTTHDVLFVADVGEEATGDLRGIKYLFTASRYRQRIGEFVALDGVGDGRTIVARAVGSLRYRVMFHGPGGHSYGSFGLVSPANALAATISALSAVKVPETPRTTFNVGVVGGGTSVNSIPSSVWMDVDLRSESPAELARLDRTLQTLARKAADTENAARSVEEGPVTVTLDLLGSRPQGETPRHSRLVETASAAVRTLGLVPEFESGSTDANLPISLGIPAITIDSGIPGGRPHSLDEWIDLDKPEALSGLQRTLLLVLSLAGLN